MSTFRYWISALLLAALTGGYAASQVAYFTGQASEYARRVDQPVVRFAALGAILVCVALAFVRDPLLEQDAP